MPRTKTTPSPESREKARQRFVALAQARTTKALQGIRQLSHLANTNNYEYSEDDIAKIEAALTDETARTVKALREKKVPSAADFSL